MVHAIKLEFGCLGTHALLQTCIHPDIEALMRGRKLGTLAVQHQVLNDTRAREGMGTAPTDSDADDGY